MKPDADNSRLAGVIAGVILITTGSGVAWISDNGWSKANQSKLWSSVTTDITEFKEVFPAKGTKHYTVKYRYTFEGNDYHGSRISFGFQSAAVCDLLHLSVGQSTKGFVNPENPTESVLLPGIDGGDGNKIMFAAGMGVFSLGLLVGLLCISKSSLRRTFSAGDRRV